MAQLLSWSVVVLAIMAAASLGVGWVVAGRMLEPLRTLTADVRLISATNLHRRLDLPGPDDELKDLGETFNELLGRLDQSFEAQRQFVANASHELRTPLARQRTLLEVALGDPEASADKLRAVGERVLAAGSQQERLIEALFTLARGERGLERRERVNLADVVTDVRHARCQEAKDLRLRFDAWLDTALTSGDERLLERLVTNLVDNALRYNQSRGWIEVTTATREGSAVLRVANSGPVVPPAEVERLFQPFERLGTDRIARGDSWGLGLSIVRAIATAPGADFAAEKRPEGGLAIEVTFPPPSGAEKLSAPGDSLQL
jgi:signal transduction histidine kinase